MRHKYLLGGLTTLSVVSGVIVAVTGFRYSSSFISSISTINLENLFYSAFIDNWGFGILTGILIIIVFAVYYGENFKSWEVQ